MIDIMISCLLSC